MDSKNISDFIVTIRASGERTENICREIVEQQGNGAEIVMIRENPFKKALETCFREAIRSGKKWLITVDADMMLLPGALQLLYQEAEKMPQNYLQLQGRIFDKITASERKAGPRIYRVSLLQDVLDLSKTLDNHIRPESRLIKLTGEKGYPSRYIPVVLCVHDFEQSYRDVYRKAYVHANKHSEFLGSIVKNASEKHQNDADYKVILKATWDGMMEQDELVADSRLFESKADEAIRELKLPPKSSAIKSIPPIKWLDDTVKRTPSEVNTQTPMEFQDQPKQKDLSVNRVKDLLRRRGMIKTFSRGVAKLLIKAGKRLQA